MNIYHTLYIWGPEVLICSMKYYIEITCLKKHNEGEKSHLLKERKLKIPDAMNKDIFYEIAIFKSHEILILFGACFKPTFS